MAELESSIPFDFEWGVDQWGYEIAEPPKRSRPSTTLLSADGGAVVRRKGGPLRMYRFFTDEPTAFKEFAHAGTKADAVLALVSRFGLLGGWFATADECHEDALGDWVGMINAMRYIDHRLERCRHDGESPRKLLSELDARFAPQGGWRGGWRFDTSKWPVRLVPSPSSLRTALFIQALDQMSTRKGFKPCVQCGVWFEYGAGTRYRSDRKYCSGRCRKAANRAKEASS